MSDQAHLQFKPSPAAIALEGKAARYSPFHLGFTTLTTEASDKELPIRGTVPAWLTGTLVRTGPACFEVG
jgi:carotenoid cleavage dioxygenase-like enzyme